MMFSDMPVGNLPIVTVVFVTTGRVHQEVGRVNVAVKWNIKILSVLNLGLVDGPGKALAIQNGQSICPPGMPDMRHVFNLNTFELL